MGRVDKGAWAEYGVGAALLASFLFCFLIPVFAFRQTGPLTNPIATISVNQAYVFAWLLTASAMLRARRKTRIIYWLTWAASAYYAAVYLMIGYRLYTGMVFDLRFALDSLPDVASTLQRTFNWRVLLAISLVAAGTLAMQKTLWRVVEGLPWGFRLRPGAVLVGLSAAMLIEPRPVGYVSPAVFDLAEVAMQGSVIVPLTQPVVLEPGRRGTGENLIFLQMESVNAMAGFGRASVGGRKYDGQYMPELVKLSQHGLLFPYFLGNGMQTSRALATVICGTTGNVGSPMTFHPAEIRGPCLSETLGAAGYTSIYFSGFPDLEFHGLSGFVKSKGFDELLGDDVLRPDDPVGDWGFEECNFYGRIFDYLRERYPEPKRLFVYIAVSRHHFPFSPDRKKKAVHVIEDPSNDFESYLNSLSEQDACLAKFWDEYSNYAAANTHLFVFGDHSWPLGVDGAGENERMSLEAFLTPLLYVAPTAKGSRERVIGIKRDAVVAQSDIQGTALELLGLAKGGNSFAGLLEGRETAEHESCEVFVQPYGGPAISVLRSAEKYSYLPESRTVLHWTIEDQVHELGPSIVRQGISYREFQSLYGCRRYRRELDRSPA